MKGTERNRVFVLEPIPSGCEKHVHVCPVPDCGRKLVLRKTESEQSTRTVTVASRRKIDADGEHLQIERVRLPGLCWCGAPLPREEKTIFGPALVRKNRQLAQRVLEQMRKERAAKRAALRNNREVLA